MSYIGNPPPQETFKEKILDRRFYDMDGIETIFNLTFDDENVDAYLDGSKLLFTTDYTLNKADQQVLLVNFPPSDSKLELVGYKSVTDMATNSYYREEFTAKEGDEFFYTTTSIDSSYQLNVFLNGVRLVEPDYSIDYVFGRIDFPSILRKDDKISVEILRPGYRVQQSSQGLRELSDVDPSYVGGQSLHINDEGQCYFGYAAAPAGMIASFATPIAPSGWLICDGSNNLKIVDYSELYESVSINMNCTATQGSTTVTVESTANLRIGMALRGDSFTEGTTITQISNDTTIIVSLTSALNITESSQKILLWGPGADSNTFAIPDLRGQFIRSWANGKESSTIRFGEYQTDGVRSHRHDNWNSSSRFASWWTMHDGDLDGSWVATGYDKSTIHGGNYLSFYGGSDSHGNFGEGSRSGTFKDDTHPINTSLQYCIKY